MLVKNMASSRSFNLNYPHMIYNLYIYIPFFCNRFFNSHFIITYTYINQVINHGVSKDAVEKVLGIAHEFFNLPVEEKMKLYSDDPAKTTRLSTSFNVNKESVHNWRDYLRLHCYPLHKYTSEWPSLPSSFK